METVNRHRTLKVELGRNIGRMYRCMTVLALLVAILCLFLLDGMSLSEESAYSMAARSQIVLVIDAEGEFRLLIESRKVARDFKPIQWFEYLLFLDKTLFVLQDPWASRIISDLTKMVESPPTKSKQLIYTFDHRFFSRLTSIEILTIIRSGVFGLNTYFESNPEPLLPRSFKGNYYENSGIEKAVILYAEYWFVNLLAEQREKFHFFLKRQLEVYQTIGYPKEASKVFAIPNLLANEEPVLGSPKY